METSKVIVNKLFSLLDSPKEDIIIQFKLQLILLLENETKISNIKYSHNDRFNENELNIEFHKSLEKNIIYLDENNTDFKYLKSNDKSVRYLSCRNILKDFYNQINYFRKNRLITNKLYFSSYIMNLAKYYLVNNSFNYKKNKYINDEVTRYIKKHKGNILLKYPILSLEYDINTYDKKDICQLYNEMIINNEKYEYSDKLLKNNKTMYYEIINYSLNSIESEDKENLIQEFNSFELLRFLNELKDYNNRNKYNNSNVLSLIKYIEDKSGSETNIYEVIYGKE